MFAAADHEFMAQALRLAERGLWTTTPNPRVGCLLVRAGEVVGAGWHRRAGEAHAETHALRAAAERSRGATAYVTLEPCAHHGRTPPCVDTLIAAGVARVVAAMQDPNPQVAGKGMAALRAAGIVAEVGLLQEAARELNVGFVSRMLRGRPWVRLKLAASLDGRTALAGGESQWITGRHARHDGHRWRARACAILTGSGTVLADDPRLTVRDLDVDRQSWRVVVDSRLRLPPTAKILAGGGTLLATASDDQAGLARLRDIGVETLLLPDSDGRVDLVALLAELGRRGVNEMHVEAGPRLNGSLLRLGLVDELLLYVAPCLIGDTGRGLLAMPELLSLAERTQLRIVDLRAVGDDFRVLARLD